MKTMRVVLDIDVDDLPADQRNRLAEDMQVKPCEIPRLADTPAGEAASVLDGLGTEVVTEMLFEGSDVFVRFVRAEVISAKWATP